MLCGFLGVFFIGRECRCGIRGVNQRGRLGGIDEGKREGWGYLWDYRGGRWLCWGGGICIRSLKGDT